MLDRIDPQRLIAPACVIDCSAEVAADEGFLRQPARIEAWEVRQGRIASRSWVLIRTDWSRRTDPAAFLKLRDAGPHSLGPSADAVRLLLGRDVNGWGVETVGTDADQAFGFDPPLPAHALMHDAAQDRGRLRPPSAGAGVGAGKPGMSITRRDSVLR